MAAESRRNRGRNGLAPNLLPSTAERTKAPPPAPPARVPGGSIEADHGDHRARTACLRPGSDCWRGGTDICARHAWDPGPLAPQTGPGHDAGAGRDHCGAGGHSAHRWAAVRGRARDCVPSRPALRGLEPHQHQRPETPHRSSLSLLPAPCSLPLPPFPPRGR